jgi:hypothetical protein
MFANWPILVERAHLRRTSFAGRTRPIAGGYAKYGFQPPIFSGDAFPGFVWLTGSSSFHRPSRTLSGAMPSLQIADQPARASIGAPGDKWYPSNGRRLADGRGCLPTYFTECPNGPTTKTRLPSLQALGGMPIRVLSMGPSLSREGLSNGQFLPYASGLPVRSRALVCYQNVILCSSLWTRRLR